MLVLDVMVLSCALALSACSSGVVHGEDARSHFANTVAITTPDVESIPDRAIF
ncbi:hypothetical protein [Gluconobacter kondonii]|uniref:hypothetical protein n=1 Tax=Gluconobacter kondonii TaxID=941463 RepID=UPI001B8D0FF6|nr:hypothetical protein [Gluconobacter kondonii]MBS1052708.1 hypothetical protein [Gluconobacter kondonii]MBS1056145.1 hypothetical protein [Gluconobacter kondonii]MBS1082246.1 hypothetical protein [Gluconobacter kondonii]